MAGKNTQNLDLIFALITVGMIVLSLAIICAVFFYQRKLQRRKNQMKNLEIEYQKNLVNASIEARELEQRRIAFELHDDVGSTLTAIKFSIAAAVMDEGAKATLNEHLGNAVQKVRRISYDLLPSILDEMGIVAGTGSLVSNLDLQIPEIEFTVQAVNDPRSELQTKEVDLAIYRVLQELLNNIIKYAEATKVHVILVQDEQGIELSVADNGKGFDPAKDVDKNSPSLGMRNMEMRMQQIGGTMNFNKTQNGTKVLVRWKV